MPLPLDTFLREIKQIKIITNKQTYYILEETHTEGIDLLCAVSDGRGATKGNIESKISLGN